MREIKFRVWDGVQFHYFNALSGLYGIIPKSVEQFTSIYDSIRSDDYPEGRPIYEGDILNTIGSPVIFELGQFGITIEYDSLVIPLSDMNLDTIEVIGNMHENPELLNREQ